MTAAPIRTPEEDRAHDTFLALLWSMAHPGRLYTLPGPDAYISVAHALLDLEVSAYSPEPDLGLALRERGAQFLPPELADYLLYRVWSPGLLEVLAWAKVGTPLAPDDSATLVLPARFDSSPRPTWRLSGPGVNGTTEISVTGVPTAFLTLRAEVCRFPLGWDVLLLDGARVLGVPRTTTVEVL